MRFTVRVTFYRLSKSHSPSYSDHEIALAAGVMHRDVSEGNVLFNEAAPELKTDDDLKIQGFLVDWDYAAFTVQGLENFNKLRGYDGKVSPEGYQRINKNLKDLTVGNFLEINVHELTCFRERSLS
jgi:hypothetical protein